MEAIEIIRAYEHLRSKGIAIPGLIFSSDDATMVSKENPNPRNGKQNRNTI